MRVPVAGELYAARYRIETLLGEGGYGWVFRAFDEQLKRLVAIKIMKPDPPGELKRRARFLREVGAIAQLSHPNTVKLFDAGEVDGALYSVSEFLDGEDLDLLLERRGPLTEVEVRHVLKQLAGSLSEAHRAGIIHRDIKPENIRVVEYGDDPLRVKLLDFGIAHRFVEPDVRLTATGKIIGTPRYMAPEQLANKDLTPASDIYSLALVAYDMLFGMTAGWVKALTSGGAVTVDRDAPVTPEFRRLLNLMLAREPAKRPPSGERLAGALTDLPRIDHVTRPVPRVQASAEPRPQGRIHPRLPPSGERFEGRYLLDKVIGEGGYGRVYAATDERMGRRVAIKILVVADAPDRPVRFAREARLIAALQCPHTVKLYDYGETDGQLQYMVCELIDGESLAQRLRRAGAMRPDKVAEVMLAVLESLAEAHEHGVLHRDIKPANIMLAPAKPGELVKLIDFGLARPLDVDTTRLTQEGYAVGTARYISPEQVFGNECSPATDLYSLGLVAFEMLTGKPARKAVGNEELMIEAASDAPLRVPKVFAPREFRVVIERMAAPDPKDRYQDAVSAQRDLERLVLGLAAWRLEEHSTVSVEEPPPDTPAQDPPHRAGWALAGAAALLLGAMALAIHIATTEPPADPEPAVVAAPAGDRANPFDRQHQPDAQPDVAPSLDASSADAASREAKHDGCGLPWPKASPKRALMTTFVDGQEFSYHVPTDYDPDHRHPVLVVFHAWNQSEIRAMNAGNMVPLADQKKFVLVALRERSMGAPWREDPSAATSAVLDFVGSAACIDRSRVFGFGLGSGGQAVQHVACSIGLAGIATVNFRSDELPCRDMPPYIHFTGLDDPANPVEGGAGCTRREVVSLADNEKLQRELRTCDEERKPYLRKGKHRCWTWSCETPFVSCHLDGSGALPLSERTNPFCPQPPSDFPTVPTAWEFFESLGN